MAYEKEKKLAYIKFVEQGKTQKESAAEAGITEKTMSVWVEKYGWKTERDAKLFSTQKRVENIKAIISDLAESTLEINQQIRKAIKDGEKDEVIMLRQNSAAISDQVSKWNKALENIESNNKVSLSTYLFVMEDIFKAMSAKHPKIYMETLDFQDEHVHRKAEEIG